MAHLPGTMTSAVRFTIVFFLVAIPASSGMAQRRDAAEAEKNRVAREQRFLHRAVEELNQSRSYVKDAMADLARQIDAVELFEPARGERDLRVFLDWYQTYADWLKKNTDDVENDLSLAYAGEQVAGTRPDRYEGMAKGYAQLGAQLSEILVRLEKTYDRIAARREFLTGELIRADAAAGKDEKNKDKKKNRPEKDGQERDRDEKRRELTEAEIILFRQELMSLGDVRNHLVVLIELGRLELHWIGLKAGECGALSYLDRSVRSDGRRSLEKAYNEMIKANESDIAALKRKTSDIDRLRTNMGRSGSLGTLDRIEELSGYYERMKYRYEKHAAWLQEQIGAYRADVTVLRSEK